MIDYQTQSKQILREINAISDTLSNLWESRHNSEDPEIIEELELSIQANEKKRNLLKDEYDFTVNPDRERERQYCSDLERLSKEIDNIGEI